MSVHFMRLCIVAVVSGKEQQRSIHSRNDNFGLFIVFAGLMSFFVISIIVTNSYYFVISVFYSVRLFISLKKFSLVGQYYEQY